MSWEMQYWLGLIATVVCLGGWGLLMGIAFAVAFSRRKP